MKILNPNTGKDIVSISKYSLYVSVMDTGVVRFLKEIKVDHGQHTWEWVSLKPSKFIDISEIDANYCSFDHAMNRAINDLYCTVYSFDTVEQMINNWDKIVYTDSIKTVYKSGGEEDV
jgi:hypothetical protein